MISIQCLLLPSRDSKDFVALDLEFSGLFLDTKLQRAVLTYEDYFAKCVESSVARKVEPLWCGTGLPGFVKLQTCHVCAPSRNIPSFIEIKCQKFRCAKVPSPSAWALLCAVSPRLLHMGAAPLASFWQHHAIYSNYDARQIGSATRNWQKMRNSHWTEEALNRLTCTYIYIYIHMYPYLITAHIYVFSFLRTFVEDLVVWCTVLYQTFCMVRNSSIWPVAAREAHFLCRLAILTLFAQPWLRLLDAVDIESQWKWSVPGLKFEKARSSWIRSLRTSYGVARLRTSTLFWKRRVPTRGEGLHWAKAKNANRKPLSNS